MVTDIAALEEKYIESCRDHRVLPNTAILSSFFEAEVKKSRHEKCTVKILLDKVKDVDYHPLLGLCEQINTSEVEAVDVHLGSSCTLENDYVLSLIRSINQKLRVVTLNHSFGDLSWDLARNGLNCKVLNLRYLRIRKLNMVGKFLQLQTLILDKNHFITGLEEDCFSCMPKLASLSMCDTGVSNLWTTRAALSKLSSLKELKFQIWMCCSDTGPSGSASSSTRDDESVFSEPNSFLGTDFSDIFKQISPHLSAEEALHSTLHLDHVVLNSDVHGLSEDSSDDSEMDFSFQAHEQGDTDLPLLTEELNEDVFMQDKVQVDKLLGQTNGVSPVGSLTRQIENVGFKYISSRASPICFEKHYRMYMINSLPQLKVLDNLPIRNSDRDRAAEIYSENFEHLPYRRKNKVSIVSVLQKREMSLSCSGPNNAKWNSRYSYARSLCAAKMGFSAWPLLQSLPVSGRILGDENRRLSPRQFEYHPSDSTLMVFGTLDGEVVVINHETGKIVSYIPSLGALNSVLGLCWLKMYPTKLIAGSANGSLKLYDIQKASSTRTGAYGGVPSVTFDEFDNLTSVHVNSTDELLLASGYSKDVALYDICRETRLQVFTDMHNEHINVVKFSNHSPYLFATSSFDKDVKLWDLRQKPVRPCYTASSNKGNVMVCFSPDDQYLLTSAVDNEVKQLLTVDGRLHLNFDIAPTGSSQNYSRSYYLNGKDYIISGSCDESLIRVCCAQTGRRLRDVSLEGKGSDMSILFVQSLRGDPFRDFNMSVLAAYTRPSSRSEIVKVNLLASRDSTEEHSHSRHSRLSNCMGG